MASPPHCENHATLAYSFIIIIGERLSRRHTRELLLRVKNAEKKLKSVPGYNKK